MATKNPNVSWTIPVMDSARTVLAPFFGFWRQAWLQNETAMGYWVMFDSEGPYRFVSQIKEFSANDVDTEISK